MCTQPLTINGYEVSCRECNACLNTYKNTWVARCVAEKATAAHSYAFTLTYADVNGEAPLGSKVYRYKDVQDFWKRIRSAAFEKWGERISLRYVVVGEKGTRFGRCHYHGVMFSSHPIEQLGEFESRIAKGFQLKRRLNWNLWGHGFIEFQMPDRKGIAYTLKYILKSRMTAARSEGHARDGKTEWLASSYLWCSKKPAIGVPWLNRQIDEYLATGRCPPNLRMRVSGGGDWYISGPEQERMCYRLHDANKKYFEENGRDLSGWNQLIQSLSDEIELTDTGEIVQRKAKEWLQYGDQSEKEGKAGAETQPIFDEKAADHSVKEFARELESRAKFYSDFARAKNVVAQCGGIQPCASCLAQLDVSQIIDLQQEEKFKFEEWAYRKQLVKSGSRKCPEKELSPKKFQEFWLTRLRPSRACANRLDGWTLDQFERLVSVTKANTPEYTAAIGKALRKLQEEAGQPHSP